MLLEHFTFNVRATARNEMLEGREHWVCPAVMMAEGVWNGSKGPVYYPANELANAIQLWNHRPAVVYHPVINGSGVSAADPDVLTRTKIGITLNSKWDGKQRTEVWVDKKRADEVDDRIGVAITSNKAMELSTGLFTDNEMGDGEFGGKRFVATARNHKPDHLAILPDQVGAFSIKDGGGLLQNVGSLPLLLNHTNSLQQGVVWNTLLKHLSLKGMDTELIQYIQNLMSHSNIYGAIDRAMADELRPTLGGPYAGWVQDVYDGFFIYSKEDKLYRRSYTATDTEVTIDSNSTEEVVRVTEYRTPTGGFIGNVWSDASREAAARARSAGKAGRTSHTKKGKGKRRLKMIMSKFGNRPNKHVDPIVQKKPRLNLTRLLGRGPR